MISKKLMTLLLATQMVIIACALVYILTPSVSVEAASISNIREGTPIGVVYSDDVQGDIIEHELIRVEKMEKIRLETEAALKEEARLKQVEEERLAKEAAEQAWQALLGPRLNVPYAAGSFKSYMSFRAITNKRSPQYKLQYSGKCWTDEYGMRRSGDDYVIAVGTYYASYVGQRLLVTMTNGTQFMATVGDFKSNAHTNSTRQYNARDKSVVEFIVDSRVLHRKIKQMGDCSWLPVLNLHGKVSHMQTIG